MSEDAGDAFAVDERVATEQHTLVSPSRRTSRGWTSSTQSGQRRLARLVAVAVRCDNIPWECGEHPALGQRHNDMSQTLQNLQLWQRGPDSPLPATDMESAVLISRQRQKSTLDVVNDIFNYVKDKAHAKAFGGPPLWGSGVPEDKRLGQFGHVGTCSCQSVLLGTAGHRDRVVVVFAQSEEVTIGFRCNPLREVFRRDPGLQRPVVCRGIIRQFRNPLLTLLR